MEQKSRLSSKTTKILIAVLCVCLAALAVWIWILVSGNNRLHEQNNTLTAEYTQTTAELESLRNAAVEPDQALAEANAALQAEFDAYKLQAEADATASADAQAVLQAEFDAFKLQAEADATASADAQAVLQAEFDAYKADTEAKLAAAAETEQGTTLAALQAEFDAYKLQAEAGTETAAAAQTALQAEFDAFKADAEAVKAAGERDLTTLQTAFDTYKADAEAALAAANQAGPQATTGADALAALQAEYDAFKGSVQADLAAAAQAQTALQSEFDAYQAEAETKLAAADAADQTTALAALQAEYDAYKTTAEKALSDSATASKADVQAAQDTAAGTLAALQAEYDAYKIKAEADLAAAAQAQASLTAEYDTYKASAEKTLSDTLAAGQAVTQAVMDETAAALAVAAANEQAVAKLSVPMDANGAGNQVNGNLAVYYEGNVYYQNNYAKGNIFVENASGFGDVFLRRTSTGPISLVRNIAAVQDGSLYYMNSNRLNRLNLKTKKADYMKNNMDLFSSDGMYIYNDKAYFLKSPTDASGAAVDNLYDINFLCNNLEPVPGVRALDIVGDGQTLYYTEAGTNKLVRFDLETGAGTEIYQGSAIQSPNLVGDTLYFSDGGQMMKMKTDGTELAPVGDARASSLNVIGDWIFYSNLDDHEKIYRITTGGLYNEKVFDVENTCCLNIAGGWIYFIQYAGSGDQWTVVDTYKARLDGTGLTLAQP